jgi:Na+-transporting NADH:ubiquinone oxidoreductase subunit A
MKLKRGLDLPIKGTPVQTVHEGAGVTKVALNGRDFEGLKPKMLVNEGDKVKKGQPLFIHKDSPDVQYVAPGGGTVTAINRGPRRVLETIVIELDDKEEVVEFNVPSASKLNDASRDDIRQTLYTSGLWTSFKTRPYSKVPAQDTAPKSIFVTAMDTEPCAADPSVIIGEYEKSFSLGLDVIAKLTDGKIWLCHETGKSVPGGTASNIELADFSGPHPAGLAGTHIHYLDPVFDTKVVWSIGYQDVIAIGELFLNGELNFDRIISIAGPRAKSPRLVRTRLGASLDELLVNEAEGDDKLRVVSGSILSGTHAHDHFAYLGRYHKQVTLITEDDKQVLLGWINPARDTYSVLNVHFTSFVRGMRKFAFGSNQNGSRRAMVPIGTFERLMPFEFLPTQLLRALLVLDTDEAQKLGALELDEEDLALCTFACPAKYEYGEALRQSLQKIEKDG